MHSLDNFYLDGPVGGCFFPQVVVLDDVVGEEGMFHANILRSLYCGFEMKVFKVKAQKTCAWG